MAQYSFSNWSYDDDYTGQEDWGAIPGYETCREGVKQSPIVITYTKQADLPALDFKYNTINATLGTTKKSFILKVSDNEKNNNILVYGDKKYRLKSIEMHSPSGHRIKGRFFLAEIHLLHENTEGDMLIVGLLANTGETNATLKELFDKTNANDTKKFTLNVESLLPDTHSYYAYEGSLPYPPCTENVKWVISKEPITLSRKQLKGITKHVGRNTRLPQPVYMREVLETE